MDSKNVSFGWWSEAFFCVSELENERSSLCYVLWLAPGSVLCYTCSVKDPCCVSVLRSEGYRLFSVFMSEGSSLCLCVNEWSEGSWLYSVFMSEGSWLCLCVNDRRLLAVSLCYWVKAPGCVSVLMTEGSWLCLCVKEWRLPDVSLC